MIQGHAINGISLYAPYPITLCFHGSLQLRGKMRSNTTDERNGKVRTTIGSHIADKKPAELLDKEVVDGGFLHVLGKERHQRGQKTVGLRLTIYTFDEVGLCETETVVESSTEGFWQLTFKNIAYKEATQHSTTAFVT